MSSKSFMLSHLARRYPVGQGPAFAAAYPHPWVVWEPGPWLPPDHASTLVVAHKDQAPRGAGEALAMALAAAKPLVLGRSEDADLPINDATLSRRHLAFAQGPAGWTVEDQGSSNGSWLDGRKLEARKPLPLRDGAQIQAGQVYLTFLEPAALFGRLARLR